MSKNIERKVPWAVVLPLAFAVGMTACGGGGSGTTATSNTNSDGETLSSVTTGYDVPSEISAVPAADAGAGSSSMPRALRASFRSLARALNDGAGDYDLAVSNTFVEEHSLEQFSIIETVLKTLAQTKYAVEGNVNEGPYQAVVSWEEESQGRSQKQLQTWTIDSRMIVGDIPSDVTHNDGGNINRVLAWIPETDPFDGSTRTVKAEFKIYSPANFADDGSVLDYGEWDLNVYFDADPAAVDADAPVGFFSASARLSTDGASSTLKVHDRESGNGPEGVNATSELKGILVRNSTTGEGYGKVSYPYWDSCWEDAANCSASIPVKSSEYSYNATHLAVREIDDDGTPGATAFKDRNLDGAIRVVHRYGLFYKNADADAGIEAEQNVEEIKSFGFPVRYEVPTQEDAGRTFSAWGYYGAWQGRHQLWGMDGFTAEGGGTPTVFTKADVAPGETAATYTLVEFDGTLTSRTLADAALSDIANVPVQTWLNKHYDLTWTGGAWKFCDGLVVWTGSPPAPDCVERSDGVTPKAMSAFTDFAQLLSDDTGRKHVNAGMMVGMDWTQFAYLDAANGVSNYSGVGFYPMTFGANGPEFIAGGTVLAPADGDRMSVDISGSIYIAYTGDFDGTPTDTGWVQKTMTEFDERNWKPVFGGTDIEFIPERGFEYYLNAAGQNFVVVRTDADVTAGFQSGDFSVQKELQSAANPTNAASMFPLGTDHLGTPWRPEVEYQFITDSANANYLMLVYKTDDPAEDGDQVGTVVEDDMWGLQAYSAGGDPLDTDGAAVTVDEYGVPTTASRPVQFNWEAAGEGESWGKQQFLKVVGGTYALLSDPIFLNDVPVHDSAHNEMGTLDLQFDGWMHGFPDIYQDLRENDFVMTPDIGGKARHIGSTAVETLGGDADVVVTDADGVEYYVKALETSLFLGTVAEPTPAPDIDLAGTVDLDSVPDFTAHSMGAMPDADIRYSEGELVE